MAPDGSELANLTNDPAFDGAPATVARSGSGATISFVSDRAGGNFDIYTMAVDGSDLYRVTTDGGREFDSAWMSEGDRLVFDSLRDVSWDIFVIEPTGANPIRLTTHPADDESPAWRPQGSP